MLKKDKIGKVEEIREIFKNADNIIFADHSGLKAENTFSIRNDLASLDATLRIIKNTLAIRAVSQVYSGTDFTEVFKGPTSLIICGKNVVAAAKLIKNLTRDFETLKIKAGILEGKLYGSDLVDRLASLPSKEVLIAQLLGILQNPLTGLATVLNRLPQNLSLVLDAVRHQKEKANIN